MRTIFVMIGIGALGIVSAFLPPGFSIICLWGTYAIGFIMSIVSLVMFFLYKSEKKSFLWPAISIGLFIFYAFFLGKTYNILHGMNEVKKDLKKYHASVQVKGIRKQDDLVSGDFCHYVYDVVLDHDDSFLFQAGYCADDGWISLYKVFHNYDELYLPKLLEEFSKNHPNSMYVEKETWDEEYRNYKLYYSSTECETATEFATYLDQNALKIPYSVHFVSTDDSLVEEYYRTWNDPTIRLFCDTYY